MKVRLVLVQGRNPGMEIPLPMPQFVIGRDPQCNLRPNSELISKMHCAILQRDDQVLVRDLKSTNGTFVNNDRIDGEVPIRDGDLLRVGPLVFAFKVDMAAVDGRSAPSQNDEDQAVGWLLNSGSDSDKDQVDLGSKTTIMDMGGGANAPPPGVAESDTKVDESAAAPNTPPKKRTPTADLAGDLLDRLLAPPRKKKRR